MFDPDIHPNDAPGELVVVNDSDTNGAKKLRFDPREKKLYSFDDDSIHIHSLGFQNGVETVLSTEVISYQDVGSFLNGMDLRFTPSAVNLALATTNDGIRGDSNAPDTETNLNALIKLTNSAGNESIGGLSFQSACEAGYALDSDRDGIPNCKDICPHSKTQQCDHLYYSTASPDKIIRRFISNAGDFSNTVRADFAGFQPSSDVFRRMALDPEEELLVFADVNFVKRVDLKTNQFSGQLLTDGIDFNGSIVDIEIDPETDLAYIAISETLQYSIHSFNFKVDAPSLSPAIVTVPNAAGLLEGIALDTISANGKNKRLFFSVGTNIRRKELGTANPPETMLVTPNSFNIGDLVYNHNDDEVYFYSDESSRAAIYKVPASGSNLTATLTASATSFIDPNSDTQLLYHSHYDDGSGSIFLMSPGSFPSLLYFNTDNPPALDSGFLALIGSNVLNIKSIVLKEACVPGRSIDSNGNGTSDCMELDLCPSDPDKQDAGFCGCEVPELLGDEDRDGVPACIDECEQDPGKAAAGFCGCGIPDSPANIENDDNDSLLNCNDFCPNLHEDIPLDQAAPDSCVPSGIGECSPGSDAEFDLFCGCTFNDDGNDIDGDNFPDCVDFCPEDVVLRDGIPVNEFPVCGCGISDDLSDSDDDSVPGCLEDCTDATDEGCGCGITDCSNIVGVFLTPKSKITRIPLIDNKNKRGSPSKRKIRFALKNFSGAQIVEESPPENDFPVSAGRKKNKKNKKKDSKLRVRYEVIIKKLVNGKLRTIKRILSNKAVTRLVKLNNGKYTVRYRAVIKRKKKTVSQTNYSPSRSFNIPLSS